MIMFKLRALIFAISLTIAQGAFCYEHKHPVPFLPETTDPWTLADVVSVAYSVQIHRSLFRLSGMVPVPDVAKNFDVTPDGKAYSIHLGTIGFVSGDSVTAEDVKFSLERAAKVGNLYSDLLKNIIGFDAFIENRVSHLVGISILNSKQVDIQLAEKDLQFPLKLTSFGLPIIRKIGTSYKGLGSYEFLKKTSDTISISLKPQYKKQFPDAPDKVTFIREPSKESAILGFKSGLFHDLFSYTVNTSDISEVMKYSNNTSIFAPRVYYSFVNSRTIKATNTRKQILSLLNVDNLITECFPHFKRWNKLAPPGTPGSNVDAEPTLNVQDSSFEYNGPLPIRVRVPEGFGNESCVAKSLDKIRLAKKPVFKSDVVPANKAISSWTSDSIDVIFLYLESDLAGEFFTAFLPSFDLKLGLPQDIILKKLITDLEKERGVAKRHQISSAVARHISSTGVAQPMFAPKTVLIYNNRYRLQNLDLFAPMMFKFTDLIFERM